MIDYKGGKVVWDNSDNWSRDDDYYKYNQDILQIKYSENCIIDVGSYPTVQDGSDLLVIMVINLRPYPNDDDKWEAWEDPFASIPCADKDDMLVQLQRAIDLYPSMLAAEYSKG